MDTNIPKELYVSIFYNGNGGASSSEMWLSIYPVTSQKSIMLILNRHANLVYHTGVKKC